MTHSTPKGRDEQVSNWESHLASIIEKTNKNLHHLSQKSNTQTNANANANNTTNTITSTSSSLGLSSHITSNNDTNHVVMMNPSQTLYHQNVHGIGNVNHNVNANTMSQPLPPPIPSYTNHIIHNSIPMVSNFNSQLLHQPQNHNNVIHQSSLSSSTTAEGVTRPIPKHVEDDLTKRIGQSVKRSIERTINEKMNNSQIKLDNLNDRIESLSDEFVKVQKERNVLSRSLSTHDRVSRRLKSEWESQKMSLGQIESMIHDEKQATKEEMDLFIQRYTNDMTSRITISQFKSAVETLSSKTRSAVEKTALSIQNAYRSDVSSLRRELKLLQDTSEELKEEMKDSKVRYESLLSTFNEKHVKDIVGCALQTHFDTLNDNATSTVRSSLQHDMKIFEDAVERKITHTFQNLFSVDCTDVKGTTENNNLVSNIEIIMKSILEEREQSYMKLFTSSFLQHLQKNDELRNQFVTLLSNHEDANSNSPNNEVESKVSDLHKRMEIVESICNSKTSKHNLLTDEGSLSLTHSMIDEKMKSHTTKQIASILEPRISRLEQVIEAGCFKEDWEQRFNELSKEVILQREQIQSECNDNIEKSFKNTQHELSTMTIALNAQFKTTENTNKIYLEELKRGNEKEVSALKTKMHHNRSLCEELHSSFDIMKQLADRVGSLESKEEEIIQTLSDYSSENKFNNLVSIQGFDSFNSTLSNDLDCIRKKIEEIDKTCKDSKGNVQSIHEKYDGMEKIMGTLQDKVDSSESKLVNMDATVFDTLQSINALQLELSRLKGHNSEMTNVNSLNGVTTDILTEYKQKLYEFENRLDSDLSKVRAEFVSIQDNILEINSSSTERIDFLVKGMKSEISSLKSENFSNVEERSNKKGQMQSKDEEEFKLIQEETSTLRIALDDLLVKMKEANERINDTKISLLSTQDEITVLKKIKDSLQVEVTTLTQKQTQDINDIKTRSKPLEKCIGTIETVEAHTIRTSKEVNDLKEAVAHLKKQVENVSKDTKKNSSDDDVSLELAIEIHSLQEETQKMPISEIMFQGKGNDDGPCSNITQNKQKADNKDSCSSAIYSISDSISGRISLFDEVICARPIDDHNTKHDAESSEKVDVQVEVSYDYNDANSVGSRLSSFDEEESLASLESEHYHEDFDSENDASLS